ncbi:hypothetical protein IPN35_06475 [Candidatus Peregrinibacteria bacterium]|nr:MAG: hypothetical protein IPN35_06475 [Candidatus Peregrinibacteria bacterium]
MRRGFLAIGTLLFCVLCGAGILWSQKIVWSLTENHFFELGKNPGYIPSGAQIRPFILGFDHFVSDLFWIRTVQYAGGNSGAFEFDALPEYLNLITDLDPHFGFVYRFGALVYTLNENIISRVPELLEKGIALNEESHPDLLGQMYTDLGFYTYFYENDSEKGAEYYEICVRNEEKYHCPPYARNVAAFLRAKAGEHEIALHIWLEKLLQKIKTEGEMVFDDETTLEIKKVEESVKLVALTCAAKNVLESGKNIENIQDLLGKKIAPCPELGKNLSPEFQKMLPLLAEQKGYTKGLIDTVNEETLRTPFPHNPFEWDAERKVLTARQWQKKHK